MNGFWYFVPHTKVKPDKKKLIELGLRHLIGENLSVCECDGGGPEGFNGLTLAVEGTVDKVGYYPAEQTWAEGYGGHYYIGWRTEKMPGEEDLRRVRRRRGHEVTMAQGEKFMVPTVRFLPPRLIRSEDGCLMAEPLPEFADLVEDTEKMREDFFERLDAAFDQKPEPEAQLKPVEVYDLCLSFLAVNYRVGFSEANVLGLFSDETLADMIEAILDEPVLTRTKELIKKNDGNLDTGGPDSMPNTGPPGAI